MKLYRKTVSDLLWKSLNTLMTIKEFNSFRLVGGTSLSLQCGHRESIDIDLFTDAEYGSLDFNLLEEILNNTFPYVDSNEYEVVFGKSFLIGENKDNAIKLDLFYSQEPFAYPLINAHDIRLAPCEEITAMKFEVIINGGRKKDFWDIHELFDRFTLEEMIEFYKTRNPFGASKQELLDKCIDFSMAESDFLPNCYRKKTWELIKLDIEEKVDEIK